MRYDGLLCEPYLNGTFAVLTYSTTFDRGTAKEQFRWRMSGNEAKLVGYRIDLAQR